MKPIWIVLLCLLGAAALVALVWLLVWYVEQRVLAKALGRVPEGADAQAVWEQHVLRKQGWTADSEQGRAALVRVRAGVAAMQEQPHEDVFTPATDGTRLHARLYRVPHAHATVILCHGYHSHAEHDFSAQFPALYASGGCNLLLIDELGDFHICLHGHDVQENSIAAFKSEHEIINGFFFGPALVVDGEVQEIPENYQFDPHQKNPRAGIAQLGTLTYALVAVNGRTDQSAGVTLAEFADIMGQLGAKQASNLDGGNSATLAFNGEVYNDKPQAERAVTDIIYFASATAGE